MARATRGFSPGAPAKDFRASRGRANSKLAERFTFPLRLQEHFSAAPLTGVGRVSVPELLAHHAGLIKAGSVKIGGLVPAKSTRINAMRPMPIAWRGAAFAAAEAAPERRRKHRKCDTTLRYSAGALIQRGVEFTFPAIGAALSPDPHAASCLLSLRVNAT